MPDLAPLRLVFERCASAGVDIAVGTDNAGLHNVRLPWEYENLLTHDLIDFQQLLASLQPKPKGKAPHRELAPSPRAKP